MRLLGVDLLPLNTKTVQQELRAMLSREPSLKSTASRTITTPNAEMLLGATTEEALRSISEANLRLPDGAGLQWSTAFLKGVERMTRRSRLLAGILFLPWVTISILLFTVLPSFRRWYLPERITGIDTVHTLARLCEQESCSLFLLGSYVSKAAAAALKEAYPNLSIAGTHEGGPQVTYDADAQKIIQAARPDVLLVAYGTPQQEQWIRRNLPQLASVRIAMGVGGAFDFLAGTIRRAPTWMQRAQLEWLWRLLMEPSRFPRIFRATAVFTIRSIQEGWKVLLDPDRLNTYHGPTTS